MNEVERTQEVETKPAPVGADGDAVESAPDPEIEAAMSQALAPVVARATNGVAAAEAQPTGEAKMTTDDVAEKPAAPPPFEESALPKATDAVVNHDNEPRPRGRNRVYDHLVEGEDDVIGLITYSLYKQDKREWLMSWQRQHGREPTADELEAFINAQMTFAQRDRYRTAARQVLDAYASVAVDLEKPLIVREGIAGRVDEAVKKVEASARWWRQLPAVLIGALLSAGIVIAVIAILVAAGVDIAGYLGFE